MSAYSLRVFYEVCQFDSVTHTVFSLEQAVRNFGQQAKFSSLEQFIMLQVLCAHSPKDPLD